MATSQASAETSLPPLTTTKLVNFIFFAAMMKRLMSSIVIAG